MGGEKPEETLRKRLGEVVEGLLAEAEAGGPQAGPAARRAAMLAEVGDPAKAMRALLLAVRLDPLDSAARLALSRLQAEGGDLDAARHEAAAVFAGAVDEAARARAAFIMGELANARGDIEEARDAYSAAARIEDALLRGNRSDPVAARWYARAIGRVAELDAARDLPAARSSADGALAILRALKHQTGEDPMLAADIADAELRLASFELDAGDAPAARKRLGEAIGRYEALILAEPNETHWRGMLAEAQALAAEAALGCADAGGAREAMDKALRLRVKLAAADPGERWALAALWRRRAGLFAALGDSVGAEESMRPALQFAEQRCAETHDAAATRFLVHALLEQADLALQRDAIAVARDAAAEARRRAEAYARTPGTSDWRAELAAAWDRLGRVALAARSLAQAHDAFSRAVELRRLDTEAAPESALFRRALAAALIRNGDAALAAQSFRIARASYAEGFQIRLDLAEADPGAMAPARDLAVALERLGLSAAADGDIAGARAAWEEELNLATRIFDDPTGADGQRFRAVIEAHLANLNGVDAPVLRAAALARIDALAFQGKITERDIALRTRLRT